MKRLSFSLRLPRFALPELKTEASMAIFVIATVGAWLGYQSLVNDRLQAARKASFELSTTLTSGLQGELSQMSQHLAELGEKRPPLSLYVGDWDLMALTVWDTENRRFERGPVMPQTANLTREQLITLSSSAVRDWEFRTLAPTIAGVAVYSAQTSFGPGGAIWVAAPVRRAFSRKVVTGYFRMDRIQRLLHLDSDTQAILIGQDGIVISAPTQRLIGSTDGDLAKQIGNDEVGGLRFTNSHGVPMLGTYRRIPSTSMVLVTAFPEFTVDMSFWEVVGFALIFFSIAWAIFKTGKKDAVKKDNPSSEVADRLPVASVFVTVWPMDKDFESIPPEAAKRLYSEILNYGKTLIREAGGSFEAASVSSFFGHWPSDCAADLVRCVLRLRKEYAAMNALRKNDGFEIIPIVFGAEISASALRIRGNSGARVLGDGILGARAFAGMTAQAGTDFLVSKAIWDLVQQEFIGSHVGEGAYRVDGYESATGSQVLVDTEVVPQIVQTEKKYLVNNGSQIIGPFTPKEIAQRLYCMEIDFDCECWIDGQGARTTIAESGMFGGSDSADARYWVFDWETVHGPMTEGFLRTALLHGVMKPDYSYCADSTASGWKALSSWAGAAEKAA